MKISKITVAGFFTALVVLGLAIHRHYGLAWDDPLSHLNGKISLAYIMDNADTLWTYRDRFYGVLFELPFAWAERVWHLPSRELYFIRHAGSFLFFVAGVFFFYLLCKKRWNSIWMGLIGAGFLVLSPRIFAEAFFNSKDIPPLTLFIMCAYTLSMLLEKPTVSRVLPHALASAALIAIRLPGLLVPALTVFAIIIQGLVQGNVRTNAWKMPTVIAMYLAATAGLTVLFWPFLWQDPIEHFRQSFLTMSHFSPLANGLVLYRGEFIRAEQLPWHYLPTWIAITTPLLYLAGFVLGLFSIGRRFAVNFRREWREHPLDLVAMAWFFGPIAAVILFDSIVYDGWRHLYFVYPALLFVALSGMQSVMHVAKALTGDDRRTVFAVIGAVAAIHGIVTATWMFRNHPYQNVYFNIFAGNMETARRNFDLDYWGLSFREGLEYIAKTDGSAAIPVYFAGGSLDNALILPEYDQKRIVVLASDRATEAKYILSNYRRQTYADLPWNWEIYSVKVDGIGIMSVFRVPEA